MTVKLSTPSARPTALTNEANTYHEFHVLVVTALTAVATIIGSGILALPVTLYDTAVPLFLLVFTVALFAQIAVVYATVELLQRSRMSHQLPTFAASAAAANEHISSPSASSSTQVTNDDGDVERQQQSATNIATSPSSAVVAAVNIENIYLPLPPSSTTSPVEASLFSLARLYLPISALRYPFHVLSFFSFVSILTSYGLAGPQALWQLVIPPPVPLQPPLFVFLAYSVIGIVAVVFFVDVLLPFFSSLTVVKGCLFVVVVIVVACLPSSARITSFFDLFTVQSAYSSIAVPFLMSTVALGGLAVTIPVTYRLLPPRPSRQQVANYRAAAVVGLILCYVLNIGWVIAILQVVPRQAASDKPSLASAFQKGQITTIPLIETLSEHTFMSSRLLHMVEIVVQLFILISTIVSFFVMAAGCKNYMDGFAHSVHEQLFKHGHSVNIRFVHTLAYCISFGPVIALVLINPKGFIVVLTRFTSTVLNLQAGFMIFVMLYFCHHSSGSLDSLQPSQLHNFNDRKLATCSDNQPSNEISLSLPRWSLPVLIIFGGSFYLFGGLLALIGPMFGLHLSASSE